VTESSRSYEGGHIWYSVSPKKKNCPTNSEDSKIHSNASIQWEWHKVTQEGSVWSQSTNTESTGGGAGVLQNFLTAVPSWTRSRNGAIKRKTCGQWYNFKIEDTFEQGGKKSKGRGGAESLQNKQRKAFCYTERRTRGN